MKRSIDRILTTHVGSLIRPLDVIREMVAKVKNEPVDHAEFAAKVRAGVQDVVRKQAEVGLDIPSDGEISKPSFSGYITERLDGIALQPPNEGMTRLDSVNTLLARDFPGFMAQYDSMYRTMWLPPEISREGLENVSAAFLERTAVVGPIHYKGHAAIAQDIENFKAAMSGLTFEEAFLPAATPARNDAERGNVYPNDQAYLYALADALREEYLAIVNAGFLLQLDLGLPARNQTLPGKPGATTEELRRASEMQIEAYNHALRGIPQDRVRYHLCWGSMNTPHTNDLPLKDIVQLILKINAQAYSIEAANPRHEHEWMIWEDVKLPEDKILIPGIISHQTNVVEHPELVAWRIKNYAGVIGRENVIAGTDCGFSQAWNVIRVHPEIQWAKLRALVEGAELASKALWTRN